MDWLWLLPVLFPAVGFFWCCCGGGPSPGDCYITCEETDCVGPEAMLVDLGIIGDDTEQYYDPKSVLVEGNCCQYWGWSWVRQRPSGAVLVGYWIVYNPCTGIVSTIRPPGFGDFPGGYNVPGSFPTLDCEGQPTDDDWGDVEATCLECQCGPALPDADSITLTMTFSGDDPIDVCLPITHCRSEHVTYSGTVAGCDDTLLLVAVKCVLSGESNVWVIELTNANTNETQEIPITITEPFGGNVVADVTILCGADVSTTFTVSSSACPVCDPVVSEQGFLTLVGTVAGEPFRVCLSGPAGLTYEGGWSGSLAEFGALTGCTTAVDFTIYCKDLGGGVSEWTLTIEQGTDVVEMPVEWSFPLSAQGDASDTITICGESVAFAAIVSDFTGADNRHPYMRCCTPTIAEQCDLPQTIEASGEVVPSAGSTCSTSIEQWSLTTGSILCGGTPVVLTGFDDTLDYFFGDFPIDDGFGIGSYKVVLYCDGTTMRYAVLSGGCELESGAVTSWDCETRSGYIDTTVALDGCTPGGAVARINLG